MDRCVISSSNGRGSAWRMRRVEFSRSSTTRIRPAISRGPRENLGRVAADRLQGVGAERELIRHHLEPHQALDTRHQRDVAHRLGEEIVSPAFEALHPVFGLVERGHHDDRHVSGACVGLQRGADVEPGHVRHHHVEKDEIGPLRSARGRALPVRSSPCGRRNIPPAAAPRAGGHWLLRRRRRGCARSRCSFPALRPRRHTISRSR